MISLIVATDLNGAIGYQNKLLWHLPKDLKHFKEVTDGKPMIMGRKTFESLPGLLPNREHIVISRSLGFHATVPNGVKCFTSLELALNYIGNSDASIIGGGEIYKLAIEKNLFDQIIISIVDTKVENADTFFHFSKESLEEINSMHYKKDEKNKYNFKVKWYQKEKGV